MARGTRRALSQLQVRCLPASSRQPPLVVTTATPRGAVHLSQGSWRDSQQPRFCFWAFYERLGFGQTAEGIKSFTPVFTFERHLKMMLAQQVKEADECEASSL